ncbi:MAG: 6,7-dimethyl-8-ribityllumazine synthase [Verrucomicrobia bacterium]|nr:6,7-dimethyl-8-ribityllumazine synthase [Verrucomicrobiota bacterium]
MLIKRRTKTQARAPNDLRIAIVAARFNASLTDALLGSALETLSQAGVTRINTVRVPGSYEIPVVVMRLARSRRYHAIIALGVILQGRTSHAEHIAVACAIHLQRIAIETGVPVIHQVLTPRNVRDARARVRLRGVEAAQAALEMSRLMRALDC